MIKLSEVQELDNKKITLCVEGDLTPQEAMGLLGDMKQQNIVLNNPPGSKEESENRLTKNLFPGTHSTRPGFVFGDGSATVTLHCYRLDRDFSVRYDPGIPGQLEERIKNAVMELSHLANQQEKQPLYRPAPDVREGA